MAGGDDSAAEGANGAPPPSGAPEPYVSAVPGFVLLAIGALMVLLLAVGWLI